MWGIKIVGDLFTTFGKFTDVTKCLEFGTMEFGDLVAWQVVKVNA